MTSNHNICHVDAIKLTYLLTYLFTYLLSPVVSSEWMNKEVPFVFTPSYRDLSRGCCVCLLVQFSFKSATETSECKGHVANSQWQRVPDRRAGTTVLTRMQGYRKLKETNTGPNPKGRFPLPEFTARVHGPSWRPVNSGAFFDTRQLGPSTRVVETGRPCTRAVYTGVRWHGEFTGRQLGPWTWSVNSGSGNRP